MIGTNVADEPQASSVGVVSTSERDEERFLTVCRQLRDRHLIAFSLGLFTLGLPYAMAGIGRAETEGKHEPLVAFWSRGRVKWIASVTLVGELYYLFIGFTRAYTSAPSILVAVPLVILVALSIVEVLYEVLHRSDGFALTLVHTFDKDECFRRIEGPALLASSMIEKAPEDARPVLGLLWAWLIGLVYITTFFAGLALAITLGLAVIALLVTLFILGLIFDANKGTVVESSRQDILPDLPPVPIDGHGIVDEHGNLITFRKAGRIYEGRKQVGRVKGDTIFFFWFIQRNACPVYEIQGNEILELPSTRLYGRFDKTAIYWGDGTVRHRLVEVPT